MIGRVLLDNATFVVTKGIFGGVQVTLKPRNLTIKAPRVFSDHLNATIDAFAKIGGVVTPTDPEFCELADDFADAVFGSEPRKQRYFMASPEEKAHEFHR